MEMEDELFEFLNSYDSNLGKKQVVRSLDFGHVSNDDGFVDYSPSTSHQNNTEGDDELFDVSLGGKKLRKRNRKAFDSGFFFDSVIKTIEKKVPSN